MQLHLKDSGLAIATLNVISQHGDQADLITGLRQLAKEFSGVRTVAGGREYAA